MARYRFMQVSYHGDRLYKIGDEEDFPDSFKPGPHMQPVDKAAEVAGEKHGVKFTGEVPDVLGQIMGDYEKALAAARGGAGVNVTELAQAIREAFDGLLNPAAKAADFDAAVSKAVDEKAAALEASIEERVAALVAQELEKVRKARADAKAAEGAGAGEGATPAPAAEDKKGGKK